MLRALQKSYRDKICKGIAYNLKVIVEYVEHLIAFQACIPYKSMFKYLYTTVQLAELSKTTTLSQLTDVLRPLY